ncbi:MAG: CAP domain-containing protein [Allosphingosinicella sp.]
MTWKAVLSAAAATGFILAGCGTSRPPWADGAIVETERPPGAPPQHLGNLPARLLALHNRERAAFGATPLEWDDGLARAAAAYGPELARQGRLIHSSPERRPGQGENLWMGTRDAYSLEEMIGSWAAEKSLFKPGYFPDVSESGHWSDVAHYTQMVWPGTSRVGCAVHKAERWDYLICEYAPTGNVAGQMLL